MTVDGNDPKWDKITLSVEEWREASEEIIAEGWDEDNTEYDEEGDRIDPEGEPDVTWTLSDALAMRLALIDTEEALLETEELQYCEHVNPIRGLTFFPAWIAYKCAGEAIEYDWCNGAEIDCSNVWHTMEEMMREAATRWDKNNTTESESA